MSEREVKVYICEPCDLSMQITANKDRIRRALGGTVPKCVACTKPMKSLGGWIERETTKAASEFPGFPMPGSGDGL